MFGLPSFLMSDQQKKMMDDRYKREVERRVLEAIPWDPEVKWQPELTFQAKTYKPFSLFVVDAFPGNNVNQATLDQTVHSPKKQFCYAEKRVKRGSFLQTVCGQKKGDVMWDGPVLIPCLHERSIHNADRWEENPWMSLTPMETMTLRSGTKRAKGRTIVAGLGLGHQLIEVSKRKQVKELVLVEQSQELVDWLLPRIKPLLHCDLTDVVIGDAYKKLPKMKADVALIDIFPSYGFNKFERLEPVSATRNAYVPIPTPGIKSIWCWGGVELRR
jgi:hypothetical protein